MPNIGNTVATLGGTTALTDVVVWLINGHPTPMSQEVAMAFMVLAGSVSHGVMVVSSALFDKFMTKVGLDKESVIVSVPPSTATPKNVDDSVVPVPSTITPNIVPLNGGQ